MASEPFLPPRWVITTAWRIHRALYRVSRGRFGLRTASDDRYGLAELETTGRRSGTPRRVMIGFFERDGAYVTMAMNGWDPAEPAWWLNLQAEPTATLTLTSGPIAVVGRAAEGDERDALWQRWREIDKGLDGYAARRTGETAVVVLEPST